MAGRFCAGPSSACNCAYCRGVSANPNGFSGPVTCVNCGLDDIWACAAASGAGSDQAGAGSLKTSAVGLTDDCGKCLATSAAPAAEALPAGGAVLPPNPPAVQTGAA